MSEFSDLNAAVMAEFRANAGRLGGHFEGASVLLLTTKGRKSGRVFTTPVMYLPAGEQLAVFATKAGADTDPDWYLNLVADSEVTVELGTETYAATAVPVTGAERERLYAEQAARLPNFAEYETMTTRVIPVVLLSRHA